MELKSNEEKVTLALLLSVDCGSYDAEASLDELCELVKSAGAIPEVCVMQKLESRKAPLMSEQASLKRWPKSALSVKLI